MKHALLKLTGLMLALVLALAGCNLIEVDPMMQLDEDFAKLEKEYAAVVATYDGGSVTMKDVLGSFASYYNYYAQMYSSFGMSIDSSTVESIKQQVLENEIQNVAVAKQIESRGLSLTDEKLAEVQAAADENYQQAYDSFYASAGGKTEEVRARQTEYNLYANGYSKDGFYKMQLDQANYELIEETVLGEVDSLTDEEISEAFEAKVAEDESKYAEDPGAFESAMTSDDDIVTWMPEGYRVVKHILVIPEDVTPVTDARTALSDAQATLEGYETELDALNDDDADEDEAEEADEAPRTVEEIQADIDAAREAVEAAKADLEADEAACRESVKATTDEIYAKLEAGEDFGDLIAEYGEDPGMQNEPTATRGYYVSTASTTWDANFTAGAMALENIGDYSAEPVVSSSGVHIIRYEADVTPGAVELDTVRDALYETTLETAKQDHLTEELDAWVAALNPVYNLETFAVG